MGKNIIFYFSGTGNSLFAARTVAAALDGAELAPVADGFGANLSGCERIGFVYPVYFGGVPLVVKNFAESLDIPENAYLFAIATCGGSAWNGLTEMNALLSAKGRGLDFGALLSMGGNYILMYGKPEKADSSNAQAEKELLGIAASVRDKAKRPCGKPSPIMLLFTGLFRRNVNKTALKYTVRDDCTSCGLCAKICPVQNIELKNGVPLFGKKCEQCMACIQWCPQKAINYQGKTQQRKRYRHPDIAAKDLMRKES
ncbi:iron-sulfur protein [Clostridia bacterium]|nr:iron-sulfur protein [Clostridia bacterium]